MTEEKNPNATAQVTVKLVVNLSQPWNKDATVAQVDAQARIEAENAVRNLIKENPKFSMVGEPEVSVIIARR